MTRERRLHDCAAKLYAFLSEMRRLGPKRVPLAFQSDASFRVGSLPLLAEFLTGLPSDLCYAVKVRWAVGVRKYLERGLTVFVFANNHLQGHGPAAARALLGDLAGVASQR